MKRVSAVVMAAGLGKRMHSKKAKVLHQVAGRPMVWYVVSLAQQVADSTVVVLGHQSDEVRSILEQGETGFRPINIVLQTKQLGTGDAVKQARAALRKSGNPVMNHCLILNGDTPLLTKQTVCDLLQRHEAEKAVVTLLTTELDNPQGYGRVVRGEGQQVLKIVEDSDASTKERALREVNVGTYVVERKFLFSSLDQLEPKNAQGEYYLTDMIEIAVARGLRVSVVKESNVTECLGINTREQLAVVEQVMRHRIRGKWLLEGVTMYDPATTVIDEGVVIGRDTVLYPHVSLEGETKIGEDCVIRSHSRLKDCVLGEGVVIEDCCVLDGAVVEDWASVGPFARLRPGAVLRKGAKVGNFVELKNAELGQGSKANHLTYLGDAQIGQMVNIGAGTITCNYDGFRKEKTVIEDGVFIGSDTQLIAPVSIGKGAVVAAGSTITRDVPADALALSRPEQVNRIGGASRRQALHAHQSRAELKKKSSPKHEKKSGTLKKAT